MSAKIAVSLDSKALKQVELQRLRRVRLAQECAKLQRPAEQAAAEELFCGEVEWPEY